MLQADDLSRLFVRYNATLVKILGRRLAGDLDTANELAQRTWLKVHRNIGRFDPAIRPFSDWLLMISTRLLIDHLRCSAVERRVLTFVPSLDSAAERPTRRKNAALADAISKLPAPLRETINVVYLEEQSFPMAAVQLGVSVGCAHKRTVKAIVLLREALGIKNVAKVRRLIQVRRHRRRPAELVA